MKRSLIAGTVLAGMASGHFRLAEDDKPAPGLVRFFSQAIELADGAKQTWVTITRTGDFSDPRYGDFKITPTHLDQMVANFNGRVLGQDVFLDVAHRPSDGAAGKFLKLAVEGGRLRGLVEWNEFGTDAVKKRGFTYLSAEYHENWKDNEKQLAHGCVLLGAGLTTRPVIKNLDPVTLSESEHDHAAPMRVVVSPNLLKELTEQSMNYLEQLRAKLLALGLSADTVTKLLAQAKSAFEAVATDPTKSEALVLAWEETGKAVQAEVKKLAGDGGTGEKTITIQLAAPAAGGDVSAAVEKVLAERETRAQGERAKLDGNLKLLADTLAEDKTLTPEGVTKLAAEVAPMVSGTSTADQVKALAALQLKNWNALSAATKLASLGFRPASGSVQISVEGEGTIKSLQAEIDKRLGYASMPEYMRFKNTGGKLLAANKDFAEKALAQFDQLNGERLVQEHKALAAGTGVISDVRVPVVAERTVLREALYGLTSLQFVNVGTAPFANVITIPYSYRDTSAANASALRMYEGQGIRRAGVIQTHEEARPIPQKLAMRISSELQLLMSASPIDFDPLAENIRNIVRIVGEDTEALNMNELVYSADEAGVGTITDTLTAQCNGTNTVFVTTKFPVVRPRKAFDLQGTQQGSTVNPITVTLNAVARTEFYVKPDGTALPNGTYYVMDYNLGELRFVDQTGATVTPTNGWVLTVAYTYSTNVVKWDSDAVNGETVKQRYDRLLTTIGTRKAVIDSDRYYSANLVLMSAATDNALTQAESFQATGQRVATGLAADGSVGFTKGLPTFNPTAPGLMLNDNRILVGERGNTRFRMVKPFSMNPIEQARDTNGNFTDQKESFGTQFVLCHTPTQLKNSLSSVIVYSATARVARA